MTMQDLNTSKPADLVPEATVLIQDPDCPEWMTAEGLATLKAGYLQEGETPRDMYRRVARASASYYAPYYGEDAAATWEAKFFDVMWKGWLCPASPVLSNMGTTRGLPISCNSLSVPDSVHGIFSKATELAMLSKNGAGVGTYFGDVRGRNTPIKGNGVSEGVIPWIKLFDTATVSVSQGSTRRGASAAYLPIEHSDFGEFLNIRRPVGDPNRRCLNTNHAAVITDDWMDSMANGRDPEKRKLWAEILKTRVETGEPYLMFIDAVNRANPECYTANDLSVKTSNICCLSGDTMVLTKEGHQAISSLVGKEVEIYDGKRWVKNSTFKQRGNDALIRVSFEDADYPHVDSNANHRWFASCCADGPFVETLTKDLKPGMYLEGVSFQWSQVITSINPLSGTHPVYCPEVPDTGKFALSNGLMTGNTEITLHTDPDHTFVCCLSSLNLYKWDEWKDTDLPQIAVRMLDSVLEEYIQKTENSPGLEAARASAVKGRAIGIGVLGWHSLLQSRRLPFDSFEAMGLNAEIFRTIRAKAEEETKAMAAELGEPEWCRGFGRRHTHLIAIAPTVSNSAIAGGYSAGIEPIAANIYTAKSAKGSFIRKNNQLIELLESYGQNTPETWRSINANSGSVLHLDFLSEQEKAVFLTAREINQHAIVKQACQRQKWVDQAQSVNLFFASNASAQYIHDVHLAAWQGGLKTLYYFRSEGVLRGDLASRSEDECKACEG